MTHCKECTTKLSSTERHEAARVTGKSCGMLWRIRGVVGTCHAGVFVDRQGTLVDDWYVLRGCGQLAGDWHVLARVMRMSLWIAVEHRG